MKRRILALTLSVLMTLSLVACGGAPASDGADTSESYTIGICQLVQHPALDSATQGFKDALTELMGDTVTFDEQNASGDPPTCAVIANQFVSSNVDLIMANATPALQAAQTATDTIPVLGTSVTDYGVALGIDNWTGVTGTNVTGTSDLAPLDQQAQMFKDIFPDLKKVGILYCSSEANSKFQAVSVAQYLTDMGYTCKDYTFSDSNDLQTVAKVAADESDVLYLPTDNVVASNIEIIKNICLPAKVPAITGEKGPLQVYGVGTLSISYYDLGYATGQMAYEILVNGADPATMEVQYLQKFEKLYNAEICEALGIAPPEGYDPI